MKCEYCGAYVEKIILHGKETVINWQYCFQGQSLTYVLHSCAPEKIESGKKLLKKFIKVKNESFDEWRSRYV